ncbi:MAG: bifunctional nuclease family protein [Candidatus Aenigmarchaeota archaeon]|nr:bifunctional nuclease family protein [Candidatus Aenigmarchaeota archaeon]
MKKDKIIFIILTAILLGSVISTAQFSIYNPNEYVEMNVLNIFETKIMFGNNCTAILARTSEERAKDIQLGQQEIIDGRPNVYDTFSEVLNNFEIELEAVLIQNVDDDYFYSDMIFRTDDKVLRLDTRPSDAIAVVLRTESKVYINKTLLEEQGIDICSE